jgi:hypothetical protein
VLVDDVEYELQVLRDRRFPVTLKLLGHASAAQRAAGVRRLIPRSPVRFLSPEDSLVVAEGDAHLIADHVRVFARELKNVAHEGFNALVHAVLTTVRLSPPAGVEIRPDQVAPLLGVEPRRNAGCSTKSQNIIVTSRRSPAASRAAVLAATGVDARVETETGEGASLLEPARRAKMASGDDREGRRRLLQVLRRQARENAFVDLVFAKGGLILSKVKASEPAPDGS